MSKRQCENCEFYFSEDGGDEPPWGTCHRFPPVYIFRHPHSERDPDSPYPEMGGENWSQPIQGPGGWCGEFKEQP